jgi:type IV fimbrial biogenesis protein FimT
MSKPIHGFTLLETMIALTILGVVLAVGIPSMSGMVFANKVVGTGQFYSEGFALARNQALTQNGASRLVLVANAGNGQFDWRIDVCFPRSDDPCNAGSANWSTTATPASGDPKGATNGFRSLLRRADALPASAQLILATSPDDARSVYFTPLGWVDPAIGPRLERIDFTPAGKQAGAAPVTAVVLTMAGNAIRCKPQVAANDPQRCPP